MSQFYDALETRSAQERNEQQFVQLKETISQAIDRSPCGTGTSSRMAQLVARGELEEGAEFVHESYIGSRFRGRVEGLTRVGDHAAIVPSIEGWARVYGHNLISVDPDDDPFWRGFVVI